jgi:DNA-binding MurR/RpiR family transcriptional regulator
MLRMTQNVSLRMTHTAPEAGGLLARLAQLDATRSERRVVEYLLSIPEAERAIATTDDVCRQTGTSRSTTDRLARRLGYRGFALLKRSLAREGSMGLAGQSRESPLDPAIAPSDDPPTVATKILTSVSSRALAFGQMLTADDRLVRVVNVLDQASRIVLVGAGLSSMVAMDMHHRLLRLGLPVAYSEDTHTQLALCSYLEPGDVVILISYSGRTHSVVQAANIARERGAHTVALVGEPRSPLGRIAEIAVTTPPGVGQFGNDAALTRLLQMILSDVLFHCLALANPQRLELVHEIDKILDPMKVPSRTTRLNAAHELTPKGGTNR